MNRKHWAATVVLAIALTSCAGAESDGPTTDMPTPTSNGEVMEFQGTVRIDIHDGWEGRTSEQTGRSLYVAAVVPRGTPDDALHPDQADREFSYLTLMEIGSTDGAESYAETRIREADESDIYSDIKQLEPIEIDGLTFYGFGATETTGSEGQRSTPVQYWYGDVNGSTYKFELYGGTDGSPIADEVIAAMMSARFS